MTACYCNVLTIAMHPRWIIGQGKHRCPLFCPLREVSSSASQPRWSAGMPGPHCVPTQLWPSQGSSKNLPSWLRFQVRLNKAPRKSMSSVQCVTYQPPKCAQLFFFFCSSRAVSAWKIYTSCDDVSSSLAEIVIWYIFKTQPQPYQTVYVAYSAENTSQ